MSEAVRIEELTLSSLDRVLDAAHLFDHPLDEAATRAFMADERHHLLIAFVDDEPAGMLTSVELLHPDKPRPEMFLYELGVDSRFRRRGIATELLRQLVDLCHRRGCGEMFVLTDEANEAGMGTYRKADGSREPNQAMFHWDWMTR